MLPRSDVVSVIDWLARGCNAILMPWRLIGPRGCVLPLGCVYLVGDSYSPFLMLPGERLSVSLQYNVASLPTLIDSKYVRQPE